MKLAQNKVTSLKDAIGEYVKNGSHISIGGFTSNRVPMAAVYEIIRQGIKNLHVYAHSNGQGVDELVGAGCVQRLEIAYAGNGRFAPTCIRTRKAVESGELQIEDYSNYQMTLRFLAGAIGIPFFPTRSSLGTDIIKLWGFSETMRREESKLPDKKLVVIENPFGDWNEVSQVVLVPAINPDVTIIHAQQSDEQGTIRLKGLSFADIEQAKAARNLIVTCEELVDHDELRKDPDQNTIPFIFVDAVVPVSYGAYPTACYRYYDYDPIYLNNYKRCAKDDGLYQEYLNKYVYEFNSHEDLIKSIGVERLDKIKADPRTGYAKNLDRR